MNFEPIIEAGLAGRKLDAALLVFMDILEAPKRWWTGFGNLDAMGYRWQGTGALIGIDGLQTGSGTVAPQTTFTLSGVDSEIVSMAVQGSSRVKDRLVRVWLQYFDVSGASQVYGNLGEPITIWTGRMDTLKLTASATSRQVTLSAESLWANRNRPPYGYYSDRDQNARFPGDRGLEQVASLVRKSIKWPEV